MTWWGDTPWSRDILQAQRKIRALQSIAPPRFNERIRVQAIHRFHKNDSAAI